MTAAARPHRHRQHTKLGYAAASVALATLAGCTGGAPAPTARTLPASPSSSTSTTSRPPATTTSAPTPTRSVDPVIAKIPAAARTKTRKGAQAFARFFIESLNVGAARPDAAVLTGLFTSNCETCLLYTSPSPRD